MLPTLVSSSLRQTLLPIRHPSDMGSDSLHDYARLKAKGAELYPGND
jgi:hypothetical protein